jgi:hypothetical protein
MKDRIVRYILEAVLGLTIAAILTLAVAAGYEEMVFVYQGF